MSECHPVGSHHVAVAPVCGGDGGGDSLLNHQHGVCLQSSSTVNEVGPPGNKENTGWLKLLFCYQALYLMTTAVGNLITMVIVEIFSAFGLAQVI